MAGVQTGGAAVKNRLVPYEKTVTQGAPGINHRLMRKNHPAIVCSINPMELLK